MQSVYFIESPENGLVKIGHTIYGVEHRFKGISTMSPVPLKVRATMPGTRSDERALHERFKELRAHGEWFRLSPELAEFIDANAAAWVEPEPDLMLDENREFVLGVTGKVVSCTEANFLMKKINMCQMGLEMTAAEWCARESIPVEEMVKWFKEGCSGFDIIGHYAELKRSSQDNNINHNS